MRVLISFWPYCMWGISALQQARDGQRESLLAFFLLFLKAGKPQIIWVRHHAFCNSHLNGHVMLYINCNQKSEVYLH